MITTVSRSIGLSLDLSLTPVISVNADEIVWDMPNEYPATRVQGQVDVVLPSLLQEKTDRQIRIAHHYGYFMGLISKDQLDAVGDGLVQVANTFIPPLGGIDPI